MQKVPIDCGCRYLCRGAKVRACNAARCVAKQDAEIKLELDFAADEATGTIKSFDRNGDVLLVRAQ